MLKCRHAFGTGAVTRWIEPPGCSRSSAQRCERFRDVSHLSRHNGGIWKKATADAANLRNKTTRDGTFNEDLTEMVGP